MSANKVTAFFALKQELASYDRMSLSPTWREDRQKLIDSLADCFSEDDLLSIHDAITSMSDDLQSKESDRKSSLVGRSNW